MIEIKKPIVSGSGGLNFITVYKDLVADGVDFTTLNTNPYLVLSAIPGNKCVVPINLVVDYVSIGTTLYGAFYINSFNLVNSPANTSLYTFLGSLAIPDQAGIIINNIQGNSIACATNQIINENIVLSNKLNNEPSANFSRFKIYFTYYLLDLI